MEDFRVTVKYLQYGQAKAYADSIYRAILTIEKLENSEWKPVEWLDAIAKRYTKIIINWTKEGSPHKSDFGECFAPHLTDFKKIGKGIWEATIIEIHDD